MEKIRKKFFGPKRSVKIDNEDFFNNPDNDIFFSLDAKHLSASKEYYKEQEKIKNILRV